jgi:hypothetical protein
VIASGSRPAWSRRSRSPGDDRLGARVESQRQEVVIVGVPQYVRRRVRIVYIELFYRNQGQENSGYVTDDFMTAIPKGAGVPDISKWDSGRGSSKWPPELASINSQANQLGFTGTPSVYVQGPKGRKVFTNVPTPAEVEAAIKAVS